MPCYLAHTRRQALALNRRHGGYVVEIDGYWYQTDDRGYAEDLITQLLDGDRLAARRALAHPDLSRSRTLVVDARVAERLADEDAWAAALTREAEHRLIDPSLADTPTV